MDKEIIVLFKKFIDDSCNADEASLVFLYLKSGRYLEEWDCAINDEANRFIANAEPVATEFPQKDRLEGKILKRAIKNNIPSWIKYSAAALIVLALGISLVTFNKNQPSEKPNKGEVASISPGRNVAILTLADGTVINLDKEQVGKLSIKGNTNIVKKADGEIVYQSDNDPKAVSSYNTLSTPRGGQYQIILPDGTKAWLNAASSIDYPTAFGKKTRNVRIKGEVYFEVMHNKSKPFVVEADGQSIQVLGTHFNVNSYKDEAVIRTTLVEGSVKVTSHSNRSLLLKPGEQSIVVPGEERIGVEMVDTEAATGWKDGYIHFNNTDLKGVLRQLARWYDIDIDMTGIPAAKLNGIISRNVDLSVVLRAIKATSNVHLEIENKPNGAGRRIVMR